MEVVFEMLCLYPRVLSPTDLGSRGTWTRIGVITSGAVTMSGIQSSHVRYLRSSPKGNPTVPRVTAPFGNLVSNTYNVVDILDNNTIIHTPYDLNIH